jgi:hypothetical protein
MSGSMPRSCGECSPRPALRGPPAFGPGRQWRDSGGSHSSARSSDGLNSTARRSVPALRVRAVVPRPRQASEGRQQTAPPGQRFRDTWPPAYRRSQAQIAARRSSRRSAAATRKLQAPALARERARIGVRTCDATVSWLTS